MEPTTLALVTAAFFAAGCVKGLSGMGLPTVVMGLLGALLSPLTAASLATVPTFLTNVWQLFSGGRLGPLAKRCGLMLVMTFTATLAGTSPIVRRTPTRSRALWGSCWRSMRPMAYWRDRSAFRHYGNATLRRDRAFSLAQSRARLALRWSRWSLFSVARPVEGRPRPILGPVVHSLKSGSGDRPGLAWRSPD